MKILIILAIVALAFWWVLRPRKQQPPCPDNAAREGCDNCPLLTNCPKNSTPPTTPL